MPVPHAIGRPNEALGRRLGFVASSLVATGAYVVGLAVMIRIVAPGGRDALGV